jgi:ketosteroid isomerase-like protein
VELDPREDHSGAWWVPTGSSRFRAVGRGSSVPIEQEVWHVFTFRDDKVASVRGFLNENSAREAAEQQS